MKFECNSTCKHAGITGIAIASIAAVYYGVKYVTKRFSKTASQPINTNSSTHVQEQVEEKNNASSTVVTSSTQQPITVQQPTSEPTVEL